MAVFEARCQIDAPPDEVFGWHARLGAFERLAPPWQRLRVIDREGGITDGGRVVFEIGSGPLRMRWEALHSGYVAGRQFVDAQVRGPMRRWVHTHRFEPHGQSGTTLIDRVEYEPPLGRIGALAGGAIDGMLQRLFRFRHARTRNDIARHRQVAGGEPLRVAVSGASGLVGSQLVPFLTAGGHRVDPLVRAEAKRGRAQPRESIRWNPASGEIESDALEGVGAVIHLAGESIATPRWSAEKKRAILDSRVDGTRLLCETLARLDRPPQVLLCASAVGFYGDRGDESLDERSARGKGFLADVCEAWEEATRPAQRAGIRVVRMRLGIVLAAAGGVLGQVLPIFRLGAGGRIGSGRQYMSWIALDDAIGAIHHLLFAHDVQGPVCLAAPGAARNAEFTSTLAGVLHRPALIPVPETLVRRALGEMGEEMLLAGARMQPHALAESGFEFLYPDLEPALRAELGL